MNKTKQPLNVDASRLITQSKYAKKVGLSPARVNQMVKSKEIKTLKIDGATLIII